MTISPAPPMTSARPNLEHVLLDEAVELFGEQGFAGSSLRSLAARLDVTVAALYYHHRTKDSLLTAVINPVLTATESTVARAERWSNPGEAGVRQLLGETLDAWLAHRRAYAFVTRDLAVLHHPEHQERINALNARHRTELARLARRGPQAPADHVKAASALGALTRPVVNLDLDLEAHRHELVEGATRLLLPP